MKYSGDWGQFAKFTNNKKYRYNNVINIYTLFILAVLLLEVLV